MRLFEHKLRKTLFQYELWKTLYTFSFPFQFSFSRRRVTHHQILPSKPPLANYWNNYCCWSPSLSSQLLRVVHRVKRNFWQGTAEEDAEMKDWKDLKSTMNDKKSESGRKNQFGRGSSNNGRVDRKATKFLIPEFIANVEKVGTCRRSRITAMFIKWHVFLFRLTSREQLFTNSSYRIINNNDRIDEQTASLW